MICQCPAADADGQLCALDPGQHSLCSWCRAGHDPQRWLENYRREAPAEIVTCHICGADHNAQSEQVIFSAGLWECYDEAACMGRALEQETTT